MLVDTPDLAAVAEALNAEPTVDEQMIAADLRVIAEREGVSVEELRAVKGD